jgi:hypothetical protein
VTDRKVQKIDSRNGFSNKRGIRQLQVCTQHLYHDFKEQGPFQVMRDRGMYSTREITATWFKENLC